MKQMQTKLKYLTALALLALAAGCTTSDLHQKENLAVAAGFKVITPTKPDQIALVAKLPADKVTPFTTRARASISCRMRRTIRPTSVGPSSIKPTNSSVWLTS